MSDFLDSGAMGLGSNSTDPVMAAISGVEQTEELRFASGINSSKESPDIDTEGLMSASEERDLLLVPQNGQGVLSVKEGDKVSGKPSELGKDPLTGQTDDAVVGEMDTLTGGNTDGGEIETRARKRRDKAGNNMKRARNLGVLNDDEKFKEFVGRSDSQDFYKFRLKKKTDVEIDLRGLSGNADLYLLNNKGRVIEKSAKGGKKAEDIERTLNPGTYYVRVQPKNRRINANYTLNLGTASGKEEGSELEFAPDEILVRLKSEPTVTQTQSMMSQYGALAVQSLVQPDPNINSPVERWQLFKLEPGSDIEKLQKRLKKDSRVELAELNYQVSINYTPNDSSFDSLWGLNNTGSNGGTRDADIDAPEAWDTQKGSKDVVVAVVDTGVDYNHPDLADNIWKNSGEIPGNFIDDDRNGFVDDVYGFDWVNGDGNPMDDHSHGTHVAGTIGAVGDNNRGVVGVSPNVSIMSLKFLNSRGSGSTYDAAQAIVYAANMGADIINASYGGSGYDTLQRDAIDYANQRGVLFVAAAGNSGTNNDGLPHYPSNYNLPNVLSVAATDNRDRLAYFSNYGRNTVDLAAPGVGILSTVPNNRYSSYNGTSMATPHVAGAAALLLAENPNWSATKLKNTLMDTSDSISSLRGKTVSGGRLNVGNAIGGSSEPPVTQPPITQPPVTQPPNSSKFITITSGLSSEIKWNDNISENVKIEFLLGENSLHTIVESTSSDGEYIANSQDMFLIQLLKQLDPKTQAYIKITSVSDKNIFDKNEI